MSGQKTIIFILKLSILLTKNSYKGGIKLQNNKPMIKFLYGSNLSKSTTPLTPGVFYLDVETKELFYDDPRKGLDEFTADDDHIKIIDTATLIYEISESIIFPSTEDEEDEPSDTSAETAILGVAILGTMILGKS